MVVVIGIDLKSEFEKWIKTGGKQGFFMILKFLLSVKMTGRRTEQKVSVKLTASSQKRKNEIS